MILYGEELHDSPWVMSVFVTLREKGIEFTERTLRLADGEHRRAPFAASAPIARVPALEHDGVWLSESLAIVEYLEERFPAPRHSSVLPDGLADRARARMILAWLRTSLMTLRQERSTATVFFAPASSPLSAGARIDAEQLIAHAERWLGDGPWLLPRFGLADADLAMALMRLHASRDPLPARLQGYVERVWQRPSVAAWVGKPRPIGPS